LLEAGEAPHVVQIQLDATRAAIRALGEKLRERPPRAVVTCARGSSDHAATYAKYLIETRARLLVSSAAPSTSSVYAAGPALEDTLFLVISQSGASADLLASAQAAKESGALVVALVNAEGSPLSRVADCTIPLWAGPEKSVAATKSFIASLAAIAHLIAQWREDSELERGLLQMPAALSRAWQFDWSDAVPYLAEAESLYVVGRGIGLGIAQEAALKLKETCGMHAEAFSAAELKHGPLALVRRGFPVLMFVQNDETRERTQQFATELVALGAEVFIAGYAVDGATTLPTERGHPAIEPILMIQTFYRMLDRLARARGRDADRPPNLHKVTVTL
jgi:glucosamine--fructose-6-phosphate aminotransferase (isomerizing)